MKSRVVIFMSALLAITLIGPRAFATPDETDLKSDLELELEGKSTKKKSRIETPAPKRKIEVGPSMRSAPIKHETYHAPEPTPVAVATPAPTPEPTPAPTPKVVESKPAPPAAPKVEVKPAPIVVAPVVLEKPKAPAPPAQTLQNLIAEAQKHFDLKHFERVIDLLRPHNDHLPRPGLLLLAKTFAETKDLLNELRTYELCLAKNPKDYMVHTLYGQALVRAKRVEDAFTSFKESRRLNPRYRPAYEAELKELEKKGERYEARNVVNDMIKVFGAEPAFYTSLCRLYWLDAFHEKVVELCQAATEKQPGVPENYVYLGLSLIDREEMEKSRTILSGAAKRFPASEPVQSAMGDLHLRNKDFVAAYNYYKKASAADPKSSRAWAGYGITAFELQKNEEALNAFSKSCALNKTNIKEFRSAIGRLRVRKDMLWQSRFESAINQCQ